MKLINKKILIISLILLFSFNLMAMAQSSVKLEEILDQNIPESWYQAPNTASEVGVKEFSQSPILDQKVAEGELPEVEKRLPDDPPVIETYDEIGEYGGMLKLWQAEMDWGEPWGASELLAWNGYHRIGRKTPDLKKIVPYMVKKWEYSNNYQTFTLYLREGMKWSDGNPFTADDYMFWWDHVANNKDLNPVSPENWSPPLTEVEKIDKYTVEFSLGQPSPYYHVELGGQGLAHPKHYMSQFHPDFVDEDKLMEKAEADGFETWHEYYEYRASLAYPESRGVRPTLRPFVVVKSEESYMQFERNPYFPFVDAEGNQLPYIDEVRLNLANSREMSQTKAATGETSFSGRDLNPADLPLYRKNEDKGNHKCHVFNAMGTDWSVFINVGHENEKLRNVFLDDRFRKALSLAVNRDEINNKVYFGMGTPIQASVMPGSRYGSQEFLTTNIEYNPEKAKEFLDDMGLKDVDDDGYREYPDEENFKIVLDHWDPTVTKHGELLVEYWDDIGIETDFKRIDWSYNMQKRTTYKSQLMLSWNSGNTDLSFSKNPGRFAPTNNLWPGNESWYSYIDWFSTGGEEGIEPPPEMKDLHELAIDFMSATDQERKIELGRKIVESQAENLWVIGLVGLAPKPVVVDEDLRNVVKKGYWGSATNWYAPYYPVQMYFEE